MRFYYDQLKLSPIRLENIEEKALIHGFENKNPVMVDVEDIKKKHKADEMR